MIAEGPREGQRVAIDPQVPCGACGTCARGLGHLCLAVRFLGHGSHDGALRELIAWPKANLVPLPDSIDDVGGAMLEPLGVALHALDLARVRPGGSCAWLMNRLDIRDIDDAKCAQSQQTEAPDPVPDEPLEKP